MKRGLANKILGGLCVVAFLCLTPVARGQFFNLGAFWKMVSTAFSFNSKWLGAYARVRTSFSYGDYPMDTASTGVGDATLDMPRQSATDGSFVYVAERCKISRWTVAGAFQGWVGRIAVAPTGGDPGCSGTSNITPGWCSGGTASCAGTDAGISTGTGVAVSGTNLYVMGGSTRLMRFSTAGTYLGWFGKISSTPTGGDAGCSGASGITPGWCKGGTSQSGTEDGAFNSIEQLYLNGSYLYVAEGSNYRVSRVIVPTVAAAGWIGGYNLTNDGFTTNVGFGTTSSTNDGDFSSPQSAYSSGSYLYVIDASNNRVSRFLLPTGTVAGWIGKIGTSPTGGDVGCSGATGITPGWCLGGTAGTGSGDGMMSSPKGMVINGTNLYVADYSNSRILRYNTSGVFFGWSGKISTSPTGGDPGCSGATGATPGWCKGGTSTSGTGTGHFSFPNSVAVTAGNIYITEDFGNRISRIGESNGVFSGWVGKISTAPTGGDPGCSGASGTTPGWCLGGTATSGSANGQVNSPGGIVTDGTNLFVADTSNGRISRWDLSGNYLGWVGRINVAATGGASGCTSSGVPAPGWCMGGSTTTNQNDGRGSFATVRALVLTGSDIITLESSSWPRFQKFDKSTGAFGGWMGKVLTSPTGGDAGCSGAAVGTFTTGWCKGGTTAGGTTQSTDGFFDQPYGLATDGAYLYTSELGTPRASKYDIVNGTFYGWIGRRQAAKDSFSSYGVGVNNANFDGVFNSVYGIAGDGTYLYISTSSRVQRFTEAGLFQGWMGQINAAPNGGDAGCSGASGFTPGWCRGGNAGTSTTILGSLSGSSRLMAYGTSLYVVDNSAYRIQKYTAATAAPQGWIGLIRSSPTGGDAGCSGATPGTLTPGWCKGGLAVQSPVDGSLITPADVQTDGSYLYVTDTNAFRMSRFTMGGVFSGWAGKSWASMAWGTGSTPVTTGGYWATGEIFNTLKDIATDGTYLYAIDNGVYSVKRFDLNTGAGAGWIGKTSGSYVPTGGAAGCEGLLGTKTPGWCVGGVAQSINDGNTAFYSPLASVALGSYLYVTDSTYKIHRFFKDTGSYTGWLGFISSAPNGGDAGCSGASGLTPGWCTGGNSTSNTGQGLSGTPTDIDTDGTYLYVADKGNHRVVKYLVSNGSFQGWVGRINAAPTGGGAGCSGASGGAPAWCMGGTSQSGSGTGQFNNPSGVAIGGSYLFVVENTGARLNRYDKDTGAFMGWVGRIATAPTGGAVGCSGTSSGVTPGWCYGGTSQATSNADGSMFDPQDVEVSTNYIYISDGSTSKISRYDIATGAFAGWYGKINSTPTGGPTGCSGATGVTTNWCKGGTSTNGSNQGELYTPQGIAVLGTNLYINEYNNHRIMKITITP